MTYLATQLTAAEAVNTIRRTPSTAPEAGKVRLRLEVASLCGTDLHYFNHFANAGFQLRNPVTLGHEACGRVVDGNGSDLVQGTLVALNPIMNCGICPACERGEVNLCTAKKFPGSATTYPHLDGFFQDLIDHPAAQCRPVGDNVNPKHLTFAEPLACALHAVNKGRILEGDRVLVTGCGPMGLLAVAAAVSKGAEVICIDTRAEAARLGEKVGAVSGLTVGEFEAAGPEKDFDAVVEASGAIPALNLALRSVRRKGRISILSNIQPRPATVDLHLVMLKEIEIVGSFQFNREFEEAVQVIEAGKTNFDALIAAEFPLSRTYDALRLMQGGGNAGKILLLGGNA